MQNKNFKNKEKMTQNSKTNVHPLLVATTLNKWKVNLNNNFFLRYTERKKGRK